MAPKAKTSAMKMALLLVGLALIGGSFFAGWKIGGQNENKKGYDKGYADAKAKVEGANLFGTAALALLSLSGTITSVGDGFIDINVPQTVKNPLDEPAPTTRRVNVTADTKIILEVAKTPTEIQKEREKYDKAFEDYRETVQKQGDSGPIPLLPQNSERKEVTLSELETGMSVTVISASDVTRTATFTATEIVWREAGALGAGPVGPGPQPLIPPPPAP